MTLDDVLLVGNFVGSLVALVIALVSLPPGRRGPTQKGQTPPPALDQRKGVRIAATTTAVLATIIVTAALLLFRSRAHDHAVAQVQNEIVEAIAGDLLTFDDLHQQLIYHSFPEVYEALF